MTSKSLEKRPVTRTRDETGRFAKGTETVVLKTDYDNLNELVSTLNTENFKLTERLASIDMMVDSGGWHEIFEHGGDGGLSLQQVKSASAQLRELVIGNPIMGQGARLRTAYIWGAGVTFGAVDAKGKSKPLTGKVNSFLEEPVNVKYLFSTTAQEELEKAAFTDGNVFLVGNDITRKLFRIQMSEMTGTIRNPENVEEIWAYRRQWTIDPESFNPTVKTRWYYTDTYPETETRQASIYWNGKPELVELNRTLLDQGFNKQIGWAFGVPDALCVLAWSRLYKEFLVNGYVMSRALAKFAYKVTVASLGQGMNSSVEVAKPGDSGSTYVGNGMEAMPNAGKGYDFTSGRPLLAMIAAGLGLSATALGADAGGGGSNAAEQTLDLPTRGMAEVRRNVWAEYFVRILRYAGNTKKLTVTFKDLTSEQVQRRLQAWVLMHSQGLFSPEIIQAGMAAEMDIADPGEIPSTYVAPTGGKEATPTDGSGQGQSSPAGGGSNDHSTDPPSE